MLLEQLVTNFLSQQPYSTQVVYKQAADNVSKQDANASCL